MAATTAASLAGSSAQVRGYAAGRRAAGWAARQTAWKLLHRPADAPRQMRVIPVPMHTVKQRQRGFNHAELLARAAMAEMRRRHPQWRLHLETSLLKRVRVTVSQAGLTSHQRRQNLRGAFFAPSPGRLAGQHVLLVDDIYTTGATARACSRVLVNAGAASVRVATVARAQREGVASWDTGFLRTGFQRAAR